MAVSPEAGSLCSSVDGFIPKLHLGPRQREIMESQTHLGRKIPLIPSNPTANPALPKPSLNPAQARDECSGHKQRQTPWGVYATPPEKSMLLRVVVSHSKRQEHLLLFSYLLQNAELTSRDYRKTDTIWKARVMQLITFPADLAATPNGEVAIPSPH